jgi:MoaA/NifB/PqqE/SkfB family radical SAM enzyme
MGITWGQLGDNLIEQAKEKRIPLIGQFELTARCNLQCKMCYVCQPANDKQAMARERTAKEWIKLAEEARDAGMLYLLLTGGEVFLRKDFREIYEALSMMGFNIEIYTNATLITPEIAKWLGKIPPSRVGVTLYGSSPETYENVCGHADGFNRAMRGVNLLLEEGIALKLKTTIIRSNVKDFDRIADIAKELGVELGIVNYISPRREGDITIPELERLSPYELSEFERHIRTEAEKKKVRNLNELNIPSYKIDTEKDNEILNNSITNEIYSGFSCTAGTCSFWVTWDGRMSPCGDIGQPNTFPFKVGMIEAWYSLQTIYSSVRECDECKGCRHKDFCMACPARLKIETGWFDKAAPYLCELAKRRKENICASSEC